MDNKKMLQEVKDKLRVTWDHEDERINTIMESSQEYLNRLCKAKLNYNAPGQAKELMLERCFYNYHNVLQEFEKNYGSELLGLMLSTTLESGRLI